MSLFHSLSLLALTLLSLLTLTAPILHEIDHAGEWIVRLVYLRRCEEPEEADWESFWSAMTFGVSGGK